MFRIKKYAERPVLVKLTFGNFITSDNIAIKVVTD